MKTNMKDEVLYLWKTALELGLAGEADATVQNHNISCSRVICHLNLSEATVTSALFLGFIEGLFEGITVVLSDVI